MYIIAVLSLYNSYGTYMNKQAIDILTIGSDIVRLDVLASVLH